MKLFDKLIEITANRVIEKLLNDDEYREHIKSAVLRDTEKIRANENDAYLKEMIKHGK